MYVAALHGPLRKLFDHALGRTRLGVEVEEVEGLEQ